MTLTEWIEEVQNFAEFNKHLDPIGASDILSDLTIYLIGEYANNDGKIPDDGRPCCAFDKFWNKYKTKYGL